MKNKKTLIISIVAVLVVAVAVLLTVLLWPKKTNKQVYADAVKDSFSFVTEKDGFAAAKIAEVQDILENKIIKVVLEDKANNLGKFEIYAGDETFYGIINAVVEGKKVLADGLFKDNKLYFKVDNALEDYYYIEADELTSGPVNGYDVNIEQFNLDLNVQKLMEYGIDSLLSSIKSKNVEKDSSSVTVNNKKYDADKYTYTYTGEDLYDAVKEFVSKVKNDDELYSQIAKLYEQAGESEYSLDQVFDEFVKEAEELKQGGDLLTYTIYVKGGNVISTQITSPQLPVVLVIDTLEDEFFELYVSAMGRKYVDLTAVIDGDTTKFTVDVAEEEICNGEFNKTKKGFDFVINITGSDQVPINGKIEGDFESKGDFDLDGTIKYNISQDRTTGVNGEFHIKAEEVDSMPKIDVSNAKHYEEMSDTERKALEDTFGEMELDF